MGYSVIHPKLCGLSIWVWMYLRVSSGVVATLLVMQPQMTSGYCRKTFQWAFTQPAFWRSCTMYFMCQELHNVFQKTYPNYYLGEGERAWHKDTVKFCSYSPVCIRLWQDLLWHVSLKDHVTLELPVHICIVLLSLLVKESKVNVSLSFFGERRKKKPGQSSC